MSSPSDAPYERACDYFSCFVLIWPWCSLSCPTLTPVMKFLDVYPRLTPVVTSHVYPALTPVVTPHVYPALTPVLTFLAVSWNSLVPVRCSTQLMYSELVWTPTAILLPKPDAVASPNISYIQTLTPLSSRQGTLMVGWWWWGETADYPLHWTDHSACSDSFFLAPAIDHVTRVTRLLEMKLVGTRTHHVSWSCPVSVSLPVCHGVKHPDIWPSHIESRGRWSITDMTTFKRLHLCGSRDCRVVGAGADVGGPLGTRKTHKIDGGVDTTIPGQMAVG